MLRFGIPTKRSEKQKIGRGCISHEYIMRSLEQHTTRQQACNYTVYPFCRSHHAHARPPEDQPQRIVRQAGRVRNGYIAHHHVQGNWRDGQIEGNSQLRVEDLTRGFPFKTLSECDSVVEKLDTRNPTNNSTT